MAISEQSWSGVPTPELSLLLYIANLDSELGQIGWATKAYSRDDARRSHGLAVHLLDYVRRLNREGSDEPFTGGCGQSFEAHVHFISRFFYARIVGIAISFQHDLAQASRRQPRARGCLNSSHNRTTRSAAYPNVWRRRKQSPGLRVLHQPEESLYP